MPRLTPRGYVDELHPNRPLGAWIRFVCSPTLRYQLVRMAEKEGVSLSEVIRRACEAYAKR